MCEDGNDRVAEFICGLDWNSLADAVRQQARLCLLDALGAMLAGTLTPASRIAAETAASLWRGSDATIFLHGLRSRAAGAAFANACAAGSLEVGDGPMITHAHPGIQLAPVALAVAEALNAGGKALLEALVAGYEAAVRAARCWHADYENVLASGSWGSLGCAAVAARLYRLDHAQVKHALGIADYHAPMYPSPNAPQARQMRSLAMVGRAEGWGAMNGIVSAELAQRGFTGIPSLLGADAYRHWVLDIGDQYWIAGDIFDTDWDSNASNAGPAILADSGGPVSGVVVDRHPLYSPSMLEDEFRRLAGCVLPPETIELLIDRVRHVEDLENVRQITGLITH